MSIVLFSFLFRALAFSALFNSWLVNSFSTSPKIATKNYILSATKTGYKGKHHSTMEILLSDKMHLAKGYNATVISCRSFGIYATLDDYGIEGLIPMSKLHQFDPQTTIQESFP